MCVLAVWLYKISSIEQGATLDGLGSKYMEIDRPSMAVYYGSLYHGSECKVLVPI